MTRCRSSSLRTLRAQVEEVLVVEPAGAGVGVDGAEGDGGGGGGEVPGEAPLMTAVYRAATTGWARAGWWFGVEVCAPKWLR